MTSTHNRFHATSPANPELATFGAVHLDVVDADRSLEFWRDRVGLQLRGEDQGALLLGTEGETLLVLHPGATGPVRPGHAGLYPRATPLPNERESARVRAPLFARRTFMS